VLPFRFAGRPPPGDQKLRQVVITLSSDDLEFDRDVLSFSELEFGRRKGWNYLSIPLKVKPKQLNTLWTTECTYDFELKSWEIRRVSFLNASLLFENRSSLWFSIGVYLLSVLLASAPFLFLWRKLRLNICSLENENKLSKSKR
jgi:hypothetical protein